MLICCLIDVVCFVRGVGQPKVDPGWSWFIKEGLQEKPGRAREKANQWCNLRQNLSLSLILWGAVEGEWYLSFPCLQTVKLLGFLLSQWLVVAYRQLQRLGEVKSTGIYGPRVIILWRSLVWAFVNNWGWVHRAGKGIPGDPSGVPTVSRTSCISLFDQQVWNEHLLSAR